MLWPDRQTGVRIMATQTAPEWDRAACDREVGLDGDHRFVAISGVARRSDSQPFPDVRPI